MAASNDQRSDDFYLSGVFNRAIRYWWLVALLIVMGGVAGALVSMIGKPEYESNSIITTVIDYAYSGRLTDYEEDHLLTAIGDIIVSDAVLDQVIDAGLKENLTPDANAMRAGLTASRQGYRWELSSRFDDPQTAQAANQVWLSTAMNELQAFRLDSLAALNEFNAQVGIENCFQQSVVLDPVSPFCTAQDLEALQQQLEGFTGSSSEVDLLSRLLASRISFEVTREPDLPSQPIHRGRNLSTLAGALIGLLLALVVLVTGNPRLKDPGSSQ